MQARRLPILLAAVAAVAVATIVVAVSGPSAASSPTVVRFDGIGPLKLGMSEQAAAATGWLAQRTTGCELAGPPLPHAYRLVGPKAPSGVKGVAEFERGKLTKLSFTRGVRTALGVVPGKTTVTQMVALYRKAGFKATARYDDTFQGTFVTVGRYGIQRLGGFAEKKVVQVLGVPYVPVCE